MIDLRKYTAITENDIKNALKTAFDIIIQKAHDFYETFPAANSENNFYPHTDNVDWTTGFWTGQLWLAYQMTKEPILLRAAQTQVDSFKSRIENKINTDHHDMGFLYSPSCTLAYKLTGNDTAKEAAVKAADNLLSRFHEMGEFFQAWGDMGDSSNYRLIIDCLLNMPLLFWASEVTGEDRYKIQAERHIRTAMNCVVRPDNSTYHTYYFDSQTGKPLKGVTCQGNRDGSAWARGQAWGIYGSAVAYSKIRNENYKEIFKGVTSYFIENLPDDLIPYWDFDFGNGSDEQRDSSAAAIAICGIHEMLPYLEREEAEYYYEAALRMLYALVDRCAVKDIKKSDGLILHGTYAKKTPTNTCVNSGVDECTAWGDYFYLEALMRFNNTYTLKW